MSYNRLLFDERLDDINFISCTVWDDKAPAVTQLQLERISHKTTFPIYKYEKF